VSGYEFAPYKATIYPDSPNNIETRCTQITEAIQGVYGVHKAYVDFIPYAQNYRYLVNIDVEFHQETPQTKNDIFIAIITLGFSTRVEVERVIK